jgi:hypothetical protein
MFPLAVLHGALCSFLKKKVADPSTAPCRFANWMVRGGQFARIEMDSSSQYVLRVFEPGAFGKFPSEMVIQVVSGHSVTHWFTFGYEAYLYKFDTMVSQLNHNLTL